MASFTLDLALASFSGRVAAYATSEDDEGIQITAAFEEDELVAEFGQVPVVIRVSVTEPDGTAPADEWLDSEPAVTGPDGAAPDAAVDEHADSSPA